MLLYVVVKSEQNHSRRAFLPQARFLESIWLIDSMTSDQIPGLLGIQVYVYCIYIYREPQLNLGSMYTYVYIYIYLHTHTYIYMYLGLTNNTGDDWAKLGLDVTKNTGELTNHIQKIEIFPNKIGCNHPKWGSTKHCDAAHKNWDQPEKMGDDSLVINPGNRKPQFLWPFWHLWLDKLVGGLELFFSIYWECHHRVGIPPTSKHWVFPFIDGSYPITVWQLFFGCDEVNYIGFRKFRNCTILVLWVYYDLHVRALIK